MTTLAKLEARVSALEAKRKGHKALTLDAPPLATDAFSTRMMVLALGAGFRATTLARVPSDYYEWPLEQRRRALRAVSTKHLTKSLVLRDHKYTGEHDGTSLSTARYVCVVVQYGRKVDTELLGRAFSGAAAGRAKPNFRMADDCEGLTGYTPNAVTPLGLRTPMPLFVDSAVAALRPYFWLGAGAVDLKWRVTWGEFDAAFRPSVAHISAPE